MRDFIRELRAGGSTDLLCPLVVSSRGVRSPDLTPVGK